MEEMFMFTKMTAFGLIIMILTLTIGCTVSPGEPEHTSANQSEQLSTEPNSSENTPGDAITTYISDIPEIPECSTMEFTDGELKKCSEYITPNKNMGLTSANVRVYFAYDENLNLTNTLTEYEFDINQVEQYHEFIVSWDSLRIVFTTEYPIRDFRFLSIKFNENFIENDNENFYLVENVLYVLYELTPKIPLVITGVNLGCVLAIHGFSFVDKNGVIRYFSLHGSMADFEPPIFAGEF